MVRMVGMALILTQILLPLAAQQNPAAAKLSKTELAGKKLFLQRCSLCHLPPLNEPENPDPPAYGPKLNGYIQGPETEALARGIIRKGTPRMPGFQYGLDPEEIEELIAYMKTLQ